MTMLPSLGQIRHSASTSASGINMRRRTVLYSALALLVVGVFILGVWAGLVRAWPVRYSLHLFQELPAPFASAPETRPFKTDSAGRLLSYQGKIEVNCPEQTSRTAVILIAGQSNAANNGAERHNTRYPDRVLNFVAGRCYVAASPLLGSTGFAGESWTPMADELLGAGAFDRVILAPVAVGASSVAQWAKGGPLNGSMIPLVQDLTDRYHVTHVLWHQGETDFALKTDPADYAERFLSFVDTLRTNAVNAPVFVSKATRCGPSWGEPNAIRTTQQLLSSGNPGLRLGVDTDELIETQDRYDDCHFANSGEIKAAKAWAAILTHQP